MNKGSTENKPGFYTTVSNQAQTLEKHADNPLHYYFFFNFEQKTFLN